MQGQERVHESVPVGGIVLVLHDELAHQSGAFDKHVLACGGRAELIGLPPVGSGLVICLLLVILLVIGEVLDAFRAVRTPLALGEYIRTADHHGCECYNC